MAGRSQTGRRTHSSVFPSVRPTPSPVPSPLTPGSVPRGSFGDMHLEGRHFISPPVSRRPAVARDFFPARLLTDGS
jgi:hypothetical protein